MAYETCTVFTNTRTERGGGKREEERGRKRERGRERGREREGEKERARTKGPPHIAMSHSPWMSSSTPPAGPCRSSAGSTGLRMRDAACPISTGRGTRRVQLVRDEGRGVSTEYEEGGGGGTGLRKRTLSHPIAHHATTGWAPRAGGARRWEGRRVRRAFLHLKVCGIDGASPWGHGRADRVRGTPGAPRGSAGGPSCSWRHHARQHEETPGHGGTPRPLRTNWTRLVPPPVLIGHASSLLPY